MADQASSMLFQIEARRKVAPYTIGVVLPLSGHKRDQWMAQKTLRGLQLGLGILGLSDHNLIFPLLIQRAIPMPLGGRLKISYRRSRYCHCRLTFIKDRCRCFQQSR